MESWYHSILSDVEMMKNSIIVYGIRKLFHKDDDGDFLVAVVSAYVCVYV